MLIEASPARRALVSRPLERASLGIAASLLVACSSADPPRPLEDLLASSDLLARPLAPAPASPWRGPTGCTGRRWVSAGHPPRSLPGIHWTSTPLFSGAPGYSVLAKYHLLEWTGHGDADVDRLVAAYRAEHPRMRFHDWSSHLELLAPDCVIVGPLGGPSPDELDALRSWDLQAFRSRTGASRDLPLGPHPVQIAILDTSPDSLGGSDIPLGTDSHGYTMGWIAREMACGAPPSGASSPCAAMVTTHLALPHNTNERTSGNGGSFGTPAELAVAIHSAVEAWKLHPPPRPDLILNLSLGWQKEVDRRSGGVDGDGAAAPANAVFDELRHAACHGALIVAAAGNEPGGTAVQPGPTYPAHWQDAPAPTRSECERDLGVIASAPLASEGNPPGVVPEPSLVVAVGGANHVGMPMYATRPGSVGRLVAPALHGAAGDPADPPVAALTGTSVSAAVASGAAALLWAHRPDLNPTAVVAHLYSTGVPIDIDPALRMQPYVAHATEVREVDRCNVARGAVASCSGEGCPEAPTCSPWSRHLGIIPPPLEVAGDIESWLSRFTASSQAAPHDDPPTTHQDILTAPRVYPQPEIPPCGSACVLVLDKAHLYVSIDPAFGLTLSDMVLTVRFMLADGTASDTHYPVAGVALAGGDTVGVGLSSLPPMHAVEARLTWTAEDPLVHEISTVTETIKMIED
ncbi:S8 family serine peptidase [Sorangium sp. So ce341]|uniref:S8 family serine peptidase n=1 Tax=Sorangium sp. So ce341 TaxID=3133302 RepID=UPI003F5F4782